MIFKQIKPESITDNVFKLIGVDWMLIAAGSQTSCNMMTASWGGFGVLWNKKICWCVIRPQRHTLVFMEKSDYFTFNFFNEKYRKVLDFCGSHSGKEVDKTKETGLTPSAASHGSVYFEQARLVIESKKIYFQDIDPAHFIDLSIQDNYPKKDYHRMYVGEIITCLRKGQETL